MRRRLRTGARSAATARRPSAAACAVLLALVALGATGCSNGSDGASATRPSGSGASAEKVVDLRSRITAFTGQLSADGGYRGPDLAQRRVVADGVRLTLDGELSAAGERLAEVGWTVRTLRDRNHGREFAELADKDADAARERGWGRVYVSLDGGRARWTVQAPHPVADQHSERLAVDTLLSAPRGVLVLAGAHRDAGAGDAADVAHREDTVFDAVCDMLAGQGLPALQVHGFADGSLPGRDVVVSTGRGNAAGRQAEQLADALDLRGLTVCRAAREECGSLEGRKNVQGVRADALGVPFLHVEFNRSVRGGRESAEDAVGALGEVTRSWTEGPAPAAPPAPGS
ncbi:hypothetical protein [Streptomyces sp. NBC_00691]|uniref:hypothetical protein n=1 Tax=Streptomyces sp. NBC_00691 TaxID=2903671 RepID=UPI002E30A62A|nr:hypothetical protein [Streptomyces sp. NBC_00691]